jgi:hypothetical protein
MTIRQLSSSFFILRRSFVIAVLLALAPAAFADEVGTPVRVAGSSSDSPTLGIPRWKGYMSPTDPNYFWISYAQASSSGGNVNYTTDGGANWSSDVIQTSFNGYVDYHLSLFGRNDELFFTWPGSAGTSFRKFNSPAHSNSDRGNLVTLAGTTAQYRSNVMVQSTGRIWVFTRLAGSAAQNVRYQYSDNNGSSWTQDVAFATGTSNVRIGSMPYVNGQPALVVLHLDNARGYEYYLWNGSSFEARPDHSIFAQNMGQVRVFTHQVVNDTTMHLIFGLGNDLHHVWKNYNNGSGSWQHQIIENSTFTIGENWLPTATVKGDDLYLFFCMRSTADVSSAQIYYKKWSQSTQSWTSPVRVSTAAANTTNQDPNTCFHVPDNATYIPVFWRCGNAPYDIYFNKILLDGNPPLDDTIAPARIDDLGAAPGTQPGEIDLSFTAPGDDGMIGQADAYEIRFAQTEITAETWNSASLYGAAPSPSSGGAAEQVSLLGLNPGMLYYVAVRTTDEVLNESPLSNLVSAEAHVDLGAGIDDPDGGLPDRYALSQNYPNPFNPGTTIAYALPVAGEVEISIFNPLGQSIRRLVSAYQPAGSYTVDWDGKDSRGQPVASGVYLYRIVADDFAQARKMVLLK